MNIAPLPQSTAVQQDLFNKQKTKAAIQAGQGNPAELIAIALQEANDAGLIDEGMYQMLKSFTNSGITSGQGDLSSSLGNLIDVTISALGK